MIVLIIFPIAVIAYMVSLALSAESFHKKD